MSERTTSASVGGRRAWLPWLRAVLAVAILGYLAASGLIDWRKLRGMLESWRYTIVAIALLALGFALVSWRACRLFAPRGLRLTFADSLRLTLVSNAANLVLPLVGGDMVRIVFTARGQIGRKTEIATVILLERVIGLIGILALPLVLAPFFASFVESHVTI
ncbi:MAG: lysylphosphatidylglycerol synthase domain-containing protein, partial [Gemmatimonas sp.]